jgi:hypothetical protein
MKVWPSSDRHQLRNNFAALGFFAVDATPLGIGIDRRALGRKETSSGAPSLLRLDDIVKSGSPIVISPRTAQSDISARRIEQGAGRRQLLQ